MAYTYAIIEAQVRANVDDTNASVTQVIDDAINLLSNFFSRKLISTSVSTVANQSYINHPTNAIEIERLTIGDNTYKEKNLQTIQGAIDDENYSWYDYNGQIQIIPTPTAVSSCKIWYRGGFTPLAGSGSTDIPDRIVPLLVILATWLYYVQLVSKSIMNKSEIPDAELEKIRKTSAEWKKNFDSLLQSIKNTKKA